jgi:hypothetical protein
MNMSTLADIVNAPTELEWKGAKYLLRQPDQLEEGMFQRWLEQRAFDAIERTKYQDREKQIIDRERHFQDVAAGVYESGGEVYAKAVVQPSGMAKMISIICRNADPPMTEKAAKEIVDYKMREVAAVLISKVNSDPKVLEAVLSRLGLPKDFFSQNFATHHSEVPKTTTPLSGCPPTNSTDSTVSTETSTAPPG